MEVPGSNIKIQKKWLILGAIGFVLIFLIVSFIASYFEYRTQGAPSEEVSLYDEDSFDRLYTEYVKDKPQKQDQQKLLEEIVADKTGNGTARKASNKRLYSKGSFDTLAVNCGILLEEYNKLVIKYHELEKQTGKRSTPTSTVAATRKTPVRSSNGSAGSSQSSTGQGFDYTRYLRSSASNELLNEDGGSASAFNRDATYVWATLSLREQQRVFNQSVVIFDVVEPFQLDDGTVIPRSATMEGTAQVSRGRARIFINFNRLFVDNQKITVEGEAFGLDKSRGLNVFIQGESSVAESFKREATDLVGLVDPSRSGVARNIIQDTDVGQEVYGTLDAGTMVLASIRRR